MQIEKLQLKEQCHVIFYPRFLSSSIYVTHLVPSFICFSIFVQGFDFAETFISTLNNVHSTVGLTRGVRLVVIDKEESTIVSLIKALVTTNFPPLFHDSNTFGSLIFMSKNIFYIEVEDFEDTLGQLVNIR